jgi:hypothetical protein
LLRERRRDIIELIPAATMNRISRRSFVGTAATGAAVLAMGTVNSAEAQLVYKKSEWNVSDFNQLAKNPARVKQLFDVTRIADGGFLNNIKNSLNGLQFGFGIPSEQIKIVAALHGPANLLNYDDFIWNKYKIGAWLKVNDSSTNQPALKNPYYPSKAGPALHYGSEDPDSVDSIFQDTSIQALQHRGVKFLSCHTALEEQVRALIAHENLTQQPEQIIKEMLDHTLPDVLVVASMVSAIALLQTDGHYSYVTV